MLKPGFSNNFSYTYDPTAELDQKVIGFEMMTSDQIMDQWIISMGRSPLFS